MAVNVGQRNVKDTPANTQSQTLQAIRKFNNHTFKIAKNKKYFLEEYDDIITLPMLKTIAQIYGDCYVANNIYVSSYDDYIRRYTLQKRSIDNMNRVVAYVQMAQDQFHLRLNRFYYWFDLYEKAFSLLKKWHNADKERYGRKFTKV